MNRFKSFAIALLIAMIFTLVTSAQDTPDNWFEVRGICAEDGRELIEVTVSSDVTEVVIIPSDPQANAIFWYPGETKTRRYWIDNVVNSSLYIAAFYGGGALRHQLGNVPDCEDGNVPSPISNEPRNECLGIPLVDFVNMIGFTPVEEGFVVDGNFYNFHETLSFLVPVDAVWVWDAYVDGHHVLRFEQTADSACAVIEVYPLGSDGE